MYRFMWLLALIAGFLFMAVPAAAQAAGTGPVYVVQPGDTLSSIAARFNVSCYNLMGANYMLDLILLAAGLQVIIPGLEGVSGVLTTEVVKFGDSLRSFVRRTQLPIDMLARLNHFVSPTELYVGASMVVLKQAESTDLNNRISLAPKESLLESAMRANTDEWTLSSLNDLEGTWEGLPGDVLYAPGPASGNEIANGLPSAFLSADIPTLPLKQGGTAEIIVRPASNVSLTGTLVTYPLHFFPLGDGRVVALQGIHALLQPALYPLPLH